MLNKEQIEQALERIPVPGVGLGLSRMNLIREIELQEKAVKITLASTGLSEARQGWIKTQVEEALGHFTDIEKGEILFQEVKPPEINRIGNIIAVISGKGGVGKSIVSSLLAVSLNRLKHRVGILDADLTGPSIPHLFGLNARPEGTPAAIMPVLSRTGIAVMSLNLILPAEDEAVIWRGPVITGVIRQFWEGVVWGNLDFLIIDLPPGTADAPLTVMQQFPLTGIVMVFTPQALTAMIVRKTVKMAQKMGKPILGLVENLSYLYIPEMQKRLEIFGPSKAEEMTQMAQAPLLVQLPIDPVLTKLCDEGKIENYNAETVKSLGAGLIKSIEALAGKETS